jgi:hypothetical protein
MADRATILNGSFQKVTLGTSTKILGAGKYSLSGLTRKTIDASEFGVDYDIFEWGSADGGTITLSDVLFDPTDTTGQVVLNNCVVNQTKLIRSATSGIRFWLNSTSYMTINTSGQILMTKAFSVEADRSGLAKCSFEGKVSGDYMIIV